MRSKERRKKVKRKKRGKIWEGTREVTRMMMNDEQPPARLELVAQGEGKTIREQRTPATWSLRVGRKLGCRADLFLKTRFCQSQRREHPIHRAEVH